jgi:hypothetical protein
MGGYSRRLDLSSVWRLCRVRPILAAHRAGRGVGSSRRVIQAHTSASVPRSRRQARRSITLIVARQPQGPNGGGAASRGRRGFADARRRPIARMCRRSNLELWRRRCVPAARYESRRAVLQSWSHVPGWEDTGQRCQPILCLHRVGHVRLHGVLRSRTLKHFAAHRARADARHPRVDGLAVHTTRAGACQLPRAVRRLAARGLRHGVGSHAPCKLANQRAIMRRGPPVCPSLCIQPHPSLVHAAEPA